MESIFTTLLLISITIAVIWLVVFLPVYWRSAISSMVVENGELRREYLLITRNIYNIQKNVQQSLRHWPIWPRPVLYSDIDYKIQNTFARLTSVFSQMESGENEISVISDEWLHNLKFKKFPLVEYGQARQTLISHREKLERTKSLLVQAQEFSTIILDCKSMVAKRERSVRDELAIWQKRSLDYKGGIVADGKEESPEYTRAIHVLEDIHLATEEGAICLKQKASLDGLQFARTEVCNRTAREAWRQFSLDASILQVEDNFDIDESGEILEKTEPALRSILVNVHNDMWDGLQGLKREIQRVHNEIMSADLFFRKFKNNVGQLKELLSRLEGIKPSALLDSAARQETKLNKLWYEYPEWERVLGGRQEPSKRLEDAKLKWELYLQPKVDGSGVIKQSTMQNLVEQINSFSILIEEIQKDVQVISVEISEQESAKERVQAILNPTSVLSSSLAKLLGVKDDTSDDISIRTTSYQTFYQTFRSKLDALNGPNYKKLESDVNFFENEVTETLNFHRRLISERWETAQNARQALKVVCEGLLRYQGPKLGFKYDWSGIKRLYVTHEQAYDLAIRNKSFRKLQEYSESARVRQIDWSYLAQTATEKLKSFYNSLNLESEHIAANERERLETLKSLNALKWNNLFGEQKKTVIESQGYYQYLRKELRMLRDEPWIDDAVRELGKFPGRINLIERNVLSALFEAQKIDKDIERKSQTILSRVRSEYRDVIAEKLLENIKSSQSPAQAYAEIDSVKALKGERDLNLFIYGDVRDSNVNLGGRDISQIVR